MIEVLLTLTGVLAGVAIVASLMHYHVDLKLKSNGKTDIPECISGIADQLQLISNRVSASINKHAEMIGDAAAGLANPQAGSNEGLTGAVDKILEANLAMQAQLAEAKSQIASQSSKLEAATQEARTDALTGLANRRALDEYLRKGIESATNGELVGFLLMDIDHFKSFNDTHGHTTGDTVLSNFARSIATCCGVDCYAARYGGEEFAVVVRGNSEIELTQKAATIRRFVSSQILNYEGLELKVTASGGLCTLLQDDNTTAACERADQGLYEAKKAGRNCGLSLAPTGWIPFPEVPCESLAERESRMSLLAAAQPIQSPPVAIASKGTAPQPANENESPSAKTLELHAFLGPLDTHIEQLRAAELPATAFMVEAIGLSDPTQHATSWSEVVKLVKKNMRGIDIACLYRQHTLCIFLPGCPPNIAVERAAQLQAKLRTSRNSWEEEPCPERLAIAVACVTTNEDGSQFLDRLEAALDEAIDATESQVVIHSGDNCHFQEV